MKHTMFGVAAALLAATALQASTVITCSESIMVANTCSAAHITDFNASFQWSSLGTATGSPYTTPTTVTAAGYTVTASDSGGQMMLADNYALISNGSGGWVNPAFLPSAPFGFTGHFDAPPDTAAAGFNPVGNPGDTILGVFHNNNSMVLGFSQAIPAFAFRVSSNSLMTFDVSISEYSGANGTGTLLGTQTFTSLAGGGNCPGLFNNPPTPCNDAPWVVGTGFTTSQLGSIVIHTNDTTGFYVGDLYFETGVPEPGTTGLIGLGLVSLALLARRHIKRG